MTFPVVETSTSSQVDGGNTTNHTVSLPSGIVSGDLLVVFFGCDGAVGIGWPGGWMEGGEESSFTPSIAFAYREADGTEGSTITVTTSASERSGATAYRISGAEDPATQAPEGTWRSGSSTTPDFYTETPIGGNKDYLWLACMAADRDKTVDSAPTNYTNLLAQNGGGANSCSVGSAERLLNASSESPGTFSISGSEEWTTFVIVVHPGSSGDIQSGAGSSSGSSTAVATGESDFAAAGSSVGVGTAAAFGESDFEGVGSSAGTSTVTASGEGVIGGAGASAGISTVSAVGVAGTIESGAGTSTASTIVAGVGIAISVEAGAGEVVCSSTTSSVGESTFAGAGSAIGGSIPAGVGISTAEAVGVSAGTSIPTGDGISIFAGVGSSTSDSTVLGVSTNVEAAIGSVVCSTTLAGIGGSTASSVGTITNTSTALALGESTFEAVGVITSYSILSGIGEDAGSPEVATLCIRTKLRLGIGI